MSDQPPQARMWTGPVGPVGNPYFGPVTVPPRFPVSPGRFPPEPLGPWHTPDIPPLWAVPTPPILRTQAPVDVWFGFETDPLPQRPPIGDPMPQRPPNSRHPITGAPTWRPELGDQPLPPSWNIETVPNGVHPITGAPNYTPAQTPMGWWPPGNRPMHTGQAGAIPAGQAGHYSYPYPTHAHEDAPQVPPTRPGGDGDGDGDG